MQPTNQTDRDWISGPTELRVRDAEGQLKVISVVPRSKRGRRRTLASLHKKLSDAVAAPDSRNSLRFMIDGQETSVRAARGSRPSFNDLVQHHRELLRKRGFPLSVENHLPEGQAARWYSDVSGCVPPSASHVAKQLARLCREDSQVSVSIRSLADAVGRRDRLNRLSAYTERGLKALVDSGWLRTRVTGSGQNKISTFYLLSGDRRTEWFPEDDDLWDELALEA